VVGDPATLDPGLLAEIIRSCRSMPGRLPAVTTRLVDTQRSLPFKIIIWVASLVARKGVRGGHLRIP
jgi:hypothetical protein